MKTEGFCAKHRLQAAAVLPHKCVEQRAPSGYGVFPQQECFNNPILALGTSSPIEAARLLFA